MTEMTLEMADSIGLPPVPRSEVTIETTGLAIESTADRTGSTADRTGEMAEVSGSMTAEKR